MSGSQLAPPRSLQTPLRVELRSYGSEPQSESHSHAQLVLPHRGRLQMVIDGAFGYAGDDRYAIVPPGIEHVYSAPEPSRLVVVDLDAPSDVLFGNGSGARCFAPTTATVRAAAALLLAEGRAAGFDDPLVADALRSYVARTLLGVRAVADCDEARPSAIRLAIEFIHASFDRRIGLADIGAAAGVSDATLRRAFLAKVGISPMRYVQRVRLRHARELLLTTDDTIAGIAARAGFSDQSHLSRLFRRELRTTPGRFRAEALAISSKRLRESSKTAPERSE